MYTTLTVLNYKVWSPGLKIGFVINFVFMNQHFILKYSTNKVLKTSTLYSKIG